MKLTYKISTPILVESARWRAWLGACVLRCIQAYKCMVSTYKQPTTPSLCFPIKTNTFQAKPSFQTTTKSTHFLAKTQANKEQTMEKSFKKLKHLISPWFLASQARSLPPLLLLPSRLGSSKALGLLVLTWMERKEMNELSCWSIFTYLYIDVFMWSHAWHMQLTLFPCILAHATQFKSIKSPCMIFTT